MGSGIYLLSNDKKILTLDDREGQYALLWLNSTR